MRRRRAGRGYAPLRLVAAGPIAVRAIPVLVQLALRALDAGLADDVTPRVRERRRG